MLGFRQELSDLSIIRKDPVWVSQSSCDHVPWSPQYFVRRFRSKLSYLRCLQELSTRHEEVYSRAFRVHRIDNGKRQGDMHVAKSTQKE
jgi:hypothetical protein